MSLAEIEQAQRAVRLTRARFETTLAETQDRLRPANLAGEAWDGVKEKSANLAGDAVDQVKQRPGMVSLALGAIALFLARRPLKRAAGKLISGGGDEAGSEEEAAALDTQPASKRTRRSK
ncbi:DUF3618 domain-containing protein [Sphingosinicella sp.]|uniref:DUF3618 domain-containing protein n=1 Tax=Sphingosinicella sp. TaxID=1917971 RepID=UPI004037B09D